MTDKRIAEFRRDYATPIANLEDTSYAPIDRRAMDDVTELLDALEAERAKVKRLREFVKKAELVPPSYIPETGMGDRIALAGEAARVLAETADN